MGFAFGFGRCGRWFGDACRQFAGVRTLAGLFFCQARYPMAGSTAGNVCAVRDLDGIAADCAHLTACLPGGATVEGTLIWERQHHEESTRSGTGPYEGGHTCTRAKVPIPHRGHRGQAWRATRGPGTRGKRSAQGDANSRRHGVGANRVHRGDAETLSFLG